MFCFSGFWRLKNHLVIFNFVHMQNVILYSNKNIIFRFKGFAIFRKNTVFVKKNIKLGRLVAKKS
jgi:hypothetical protein